MRVSAGGDSGSRDRSGRRGHWFRYRWGHGCFCGRGPGEACSLEQGPVLSEELASESFRHNTFYGVKSLPHIAVTKTGADGTVNRFLPTVVGGLANFYQAVSLRMREAEFRRWPIEYAQLEPYYSRAEELLGVAGMVGDDPYEPPRSRPYPYALPEPTAAGRRIIDATRRHGVRAFRHPLAIRFDRGCQRCFYCA
jgi:choline dehydrogenase-like flavoprotein